MKPKTLLITAIIFSQVSFAQKEEAWIRFYDSVSSQSGYKDLKGNIKIPLQFTDFAPADTFHNIIAVSERINNSSVYYYLLKNGNKIGKDSVYMFDFTFDCESEDKIIFWDRKKDRVGFFNKYGKVIIPALYNFVTPFRNGVALARRNAKRKCWDGADTIKCEHLGWEGGENILINDKNEVLADSVNVNPDGINWYSLRINDQATDTSLYTSIRGQNGNTYYFINYYKEFNKWLYHVFIPAIRTNHQNDITKLLFPEIVYYSEPVGWTNVTSKDFFKAFPASLIQKSLEKKHLKEIRVMHDHLNLFIFDKDIYRRYLNSCSDHNWSKYPVFSVLVTYYKKRPVPSEYSTGFFKDHDIDYQEDMEFLRTDDGYKLLSVSIKK